MIIESSKSDGLFSIHATSFRAERDKRHFIIIIFGGGELNIIGQKVAFKKMWKLESVKKCLDRLEGTFPFVRREYDSYLCQIRGLL